MTNNTPKRILFLHATWHKSSEYNVHKLLAENVDPDEVDSYFIWQTHTQDASKNVPANLRRPNRNFFYDFGRDMSLRPKPSKLKRAIMMFYRFPFAMFFLIRKMRTIKPHIIYTSQQTYEVFLATIISTLFHIPHFIHISYPVGEWLGKRTLKTILHTPNLIACSEFVRQTAIDEGVPPGNIDTLLHGANVEMYAIPHNSQWLREEFDLPANTSVIVTAARLDPGKGYTVLLKAFARVNEQNPHTHLIACGEGTTGTGYDNYIKDLASELGLDKVVTFANFRSDLPQIFAGADIFCMPTKEDALPLVFLGAMAAKLPVVGVRSGGVPEMVLHEETGLLAEPDNVDELTTHLNTLIDNKDLAIKLGENGQKRAFNEFDPVKASCKWTGILHKQLTRSNRS